MVALAKTSNKLIRIRGFRIDYIAHAHHRFVLGERIERNLYGLLETLIQAKYTRNRQRLLEQANLALEVLRFQMRLAKDLQCLKVNSYGFASKAIDDIGRQLGGWLRSLPEAADA
jgi:hypothetical protein